MMYTCRGKQTTTVPTNLWLSDARNKVSQKRLWIEIDRKMKCEKQYKSQVVMLYIEGASERVDRAIKT